MKCLNRRNQFKFKMKSYIPDQFNDNKSRKIQLPDYIFGFSFSQFSQFVDYFFSQLRSGAFPQNTWIKPCLCSISYENWIQINTGSFLLISSKIRILLYVLYWSGSTLYDASCYSTLCVLSKKTLTSPDRKHFSSTEGS